MTPSGNPGLDRARQQWWDEKMHAIGLAVDATLNPKIGDAHDPGRRFGFVLMTFPFDGPPGSRLQYISNGVDPADLVKLLREVIAQAEFQAANTGHG